jgi:putative endonuclease
VGDKYYVYILVSEVDGTLYTGQTNDLSDRLRRHNRGQIRVTKGKVPWRLGYAEILQTRSEAMWREWELKRKWNTDRKKKLIDKFDPKQIESLGL